jgi:hypothetical protein
MGVDISVVLVRCVLEITHAVELVLKLSGRRILGVSNGQINHSEMALQYYTLHPGIENRK